LSPVIAPGTSAIAGPEAGRWRPCTAPGQVWTDPDQVLRFVCATHRRQLTALHAAGLADRIRWGRPGLPTDPAPSTAGGEASVKLVRDRIPELAAVTQPQLPAPDHPAGGNGSGPPRDSRTRVRELVARERATGIRPHARDVAAAAGISERRADELLRAVRAGGGQP
jgi:hypothetical protein